LESCPKTKSQKKRQNTLGEKFASKKEITETSACKQYPVPVSLGKTQCITARTLRKCILSSALARPPENFKPSFTFAGCTERKDNRMNK
jgi:hypothetical protein